MHVLYDKNRDRRQVTGPSLLHGSYVPSTLRRYASDCVDRRPVIHKRRSTAHRWRCRLSHMLLQKYYKMQHILLITDSLSGAPWLTFLVTDLLHLLVTSRRADVKLSSARYSRSNCPKTDPSFLVSHLLTLKISPQKEKILSPDNRSTIVQNFTPIGVCTVAEISITGQIETKRKNYSRLDIRQNA